MFGSLRKRGGTIVLAAIVGAVAAGSPAVAAQVVAFAKSAGNANTVNKIGASKTPRAGMLVPLNANGKFPAAVIPATRQAVALAGPAGPGGPQGLQGTPGASGANGATGAQGPKGLPGADGAIGPQGGKGEPGTDGTNGTNGAAGDKGEPGTDGANGTNGAAGDKGDKGDKGDQGEQGPAGGVVYPALVDVNPIPQANASHKWDAFIVRGDSLNHGYRSSHTDGDATSWVEWQVPLETGDWALEVTYAKGDDAGQMTFSLDTPPQVLGVVDGYSAAIEQNARTTLPTFAVSTSGIHTLRVSTEAKNDASSNVYGYLVWLRLVKQ